MGICSGTSTEWLFVHCSRSNWNLAVLIFAEGGKPENPEKNPRSEDENQQQTQPTYGTGPESNPGHIGGRRVLSPLRHPRSPPKWCVQEKQSENVSYQLLNTEHFFFLKFLAFTSRTTSAEVSFLLQFYSILNRYVQPRITALRS